MKKSRTSGVANSARLINMRTHNITLCIVLVFSILVARVEACGQCVDHIIRISHPLLGFAMLMFLVWFIFVIGIKRRYKGRIPEKRYCITQYNV